MMLALLRLIHMFQFKAISPFASTQTSEACYTRPRLGKPETC
jgi:hypothetical protein